MSAFPNLSAGVIVVPPSGPSLTLHLVSNFNRSNKARLLWSKQTGLAGLLQRASEVLRLTAIRVYSADGELIADGEVVQDNETLFISGGEPFLAAQAVDKPVVLETKRGESVQLAVPLESNPPATAPHSPDAGQQPWGRGYSRWGRQGNWGSYYRYRCNKCVSLLFAIGLVFIIVGATTNSWAVGEGEVRHGLWHTVVGRHSHNTQPLTCSGTGCAHKNLWQGFAITTMVTSALAFILHLISRRRQSCGVMCWKHASAFFAVAFGIATISVWATDNKHRYVDYSFGYSFWLFLVGLALTLIGYGISRKVWKWQRWVDNGGQDNCCFSSGSCGSSSSTTAPGPCSAPSSGSAAGEQGGCSRDGGGCWFSRRWGCGSSRWQAWRNRGGNGNSNISHVNINADAPTVAELEHGSSSSSASNYAPVYSAPSGQYAYLA